MALIADGVSALFIDGKPCPGSAGTFPTVNPATEEVLGVAADADADDMGRAIDAARRAFDETDWSRNTELRVRCIRQLRDAMKEHLEELREITIAEVGAPRMLTAIAQLEVPSMTWRSRPTRPSPTSGIRISVMRRRWGSPPGARSRAKPSGSSAPSPRGTSPIRSTSPRSGPALAAGNTVVLKPAPDTPWCAAVLGRTHRRAHRLSARRNQHRHLQRPRRRRDAGQRPSGRHGFVHRLDGHRSQRDGRRRRHHQEGVPGAGRQVGVHRARRRRPRRCRRGSGVHGVHARRARVRDHHPAGGAAGPLRRGGLHRGRHHGRDQAGRPQRPENHLRAIDLRAPAGPGAGLPGPRRSPRAGRSRAAAAARPTARSVTSSSPP